MVGVNISNLGSL